MRISILYGTESGNAELAADDVATALEDIVQATVTDLSDIRAGVLSPDHTYLIICSTYGDGELPASAQPFHESLMTERPDLSGVHYAMFGLGDSGYGETYSRGSHTLDEMLAGLGATRIGEFGHHDASGTDGAGDAAADWAREILSTIGAAV